MLVILAQLMLTTTTLLLLVGVWVGLEPLLGDLLPAHLIATVYLTYATLMVILVLLSKLARLFLRGKTGRLESKVNLFGWALQDWSYQVGLRLSHMVFLYPLLPGQIHGLFGLRRRKGTSLLGSFYDIDLLDIGRHCMVGTGATLAAHVVEDGVVKRAPIRVGDHSTVGAFTLVAPGVTIGENVVVAAYSFVPKHAILEPNTVYAGVPARKIADRPSLEGQT